jgi:hypothetical protein
MKRQMNENKNAATPLENGAYTHSTYLDFCKGILVISVIFIHVTFWSGSSYVPGWIRNASLLIDVPLFFFLSGTGTAMSRELCLSRTLKACLEIMVKYMFFTLFYYVAWHAYYKIKKFSYGFTVSETANLLTANFAFAGESLPNLQGVIDSVWFMPVYFSVRVICVSVLYLVSGAKHNYRHAVVLLALFIIGLNFVINEAGFFYLSRNVLFYSVFFLLGYVLKGKPLTLQGFLIIILFLIIGMLFLNKVFAVSFSVVQQLKFPPSWGYMLYSGFGVALILFFVNFSPKASNPLVYMGQNCIWFFFAQSLSGSVVAKTAPLIDLPWQPKLTICFMTNLVLAGIIALVLKYLWFLLGKIKTKQPIKIFRDSA